MIDGVECFDSTRIKFPGRHEVDGWFYQRRLVLFFAAAVVAGSTAAQV